MSEVSGIKFKRIINRKTGQIAGTIAYRINFTENVYELGVATLHPRDVYSPTEGKNIAMERLLTKEEFHSATITPADIYSRVHVHGDHVLSTAGKEELARVLNSVFRVGKFNTKAVCEAAFEAFGADLATYR